MDDSEEFEEGYKAFNEGAEPSDCPYEYGEQHSVDWHEGYAEAKADSEAKER